MPDLGEGKEMTDKINFPLKLREVEIEAMDNDTCNSAFAGDKLSVAETEICAMYQGTTKASCQGCGAGYGCLFGLRYCLFRHILLHHGCPPGQNRAAC